jgi:hypothetical protein
VPGEKAGCARALSAEAFFRLDFLVHFVSRQKNKEPEAGDRKIHKVTISQKAKTNYKII